MTKLKTVEALVASSRCDVGDVVTGCWVVQDYEVRNLLTQDRANILAVLREGVEAKRKLTLTHEEIQLLDRHEREEYNEEVVGYNQALDDILTLLQETLGKK